MKNVNKSGNINSMIVFFDEFQIDSFVEGLILCDIYYLFGM